MSGEQRKTGWKVAGFGGDYTRGWKNYRRRRRWFGGIIFGSFVIAMISAALIRDKSLVESGIGGKRQRLGRMAVDFPAHFQLSLAGNATFAADQPLDLCA